MKVDKDFIKQLNQYTRKSLFYYKFNEQKYRSQKGYVDWDRVIFEIARSRVSYQNYDIPFFEQEISHRNALIVLNQAYYLGFSSFWLGEKLFDAFCQTHLPSTLSEIRRIVPVGLILLPPKIKNPDGQTIKWVMFYYRLKDELTLPIKLSDKILEIQGDKEDCLTWFTILDDGTQYGGNRYLKIENQHLEFGTDNMYISEIFQYEGKNINTESEKEFTDKITEILIQTFLYLQLNNVIQENVSKSKSSKQKLEPFIIGNEYQFKTDSSLTGTKSTHWRRGHWRNQPYGSKENTQYKLIWIEPVLINPQIRCRSRFCNS